MAINQYLKQLIKVLTVRKKLLAFLFTSTSMIFILLLLNNSNKILFPSNFLMNFYSPWSTVKLKQYPAGIPHKPIGGNDQVRMFYPYREFINDSVKNGQIPLWNPYNFSGSPLIADFQSAFFYPLNIFYYFLPIADAWSLLVLLQPVLAGWFIFLYLDKHINSLTAKLFSAVSFGLSGFIITWSQENAVVGHSGLWVPLILLTVENFILNSNRKNFILLVLSLSFSFLGGHYQFSIYGLLIGFIYGIFLIYKQRKASNQVKLHKSILLLTAYFLMLGLVSIQLLPSIEAFTQSPRSSASSVSVVLNYLVPATHFINAIAPDIFGNPGSYNYFGRGFYQEQIFYAGLLPLLLSLYILFRKHESALIGFFSSVLIISYFLAVDSPITRFIFTLPIPILSTFTPSRILMISTFCLSVLSSFGLSFLIKNYSVIEKKRLYFISAGLMTVLTMVILIIYLDARDKNVYWTSLTSFLIKPDIQISQKNLNIAMRNIVLPVSLIVIFCTALLLNLNPKKLKVMVLILTVFAQCYFLNKYLVIGQRAFLYPDHFVLADIRAQSNDYQRFLSFGTPILGNVALNADVYSPDGIDPVFPGRYGQLIFASKNNGKFIRNIPRIEANLSEYHENRNIINNPLRLRLFELLGVKNVYNYQPVYDSLSNIPEIFPDNLFSQSWNKDGWTAYQFRNPLPRAFLVPGFQVETDPQKILNKIFDPRTDLRNTVILEKAPQLELTSQINQNLFIDETKIINYTPNKVEITTASDNNSLLFLSDNYYPGWKVYVDGKPNKIYRANFTFRAVEVPSGKHNITFIFNPDSFRYGAWISLSTVILLLVISLTRPAKFTPASSGEE